MKQLDKSNRLEYLDICKGVGIFFILFGHIMNEQNAFIKYISTYKITIFYIIIGILIAYQNRTKFEVQKRFTSLMKPYLIFSVMVIVFNFCINYFIKHDNNILDYLLKDIIVSVSLRGISTLWFLPSLFLGEYIFYKTLNHLYRKVLLILSPGVIILLAALWEFEDNMISYCILVISKSIIVSWFIYAGYLGYKLLTYNRMQNLGKIGAVGLVLSLGNLYLSQKNFNIDFNQLKFGEVPYLFFATGVIGSWGMVLLAQFLFSGKTGYLKGNVLSYFGRNSLIIMLTHLPFRMVSIVLFVVNLVFKDYYVICIVSFIILILVERILIEVINSYFPEIIGKKRKRYN